MKRIIFEILLEFFLPYSRSLKDKRNVMRSIKDRMKKFNLAVAEVGFWNLQQRGLISFVGIASNNQPLDSIIENIMKTLLDLSMRLDFTVINIKKELYQ